MTKLKRKPGTARAHPDKATPADTKALAAYSARRKRRMPARVNVEQRLNGSNIRPDHPDGNYGTLTLLQAFGTGSTAFMDSLRRLGPELERLAQVVERPRLRLVSGGRA